MARGYGCSFRHHRARADQGPAADRSTGEHDGANSDQCPVFDGCSMDDGPVPYGHHLTEHAGLLYIRVHDCEILDIGASTNDYRRVLGSQHAPEPDARLDSEVHLSDDGGIGRHERCHIDEVWVIRDVHLARILPQVARTFELMVRRSIDSTLLAGRVRDAL